MYNNNKEKKKQSEEFIFNTIRLKETNEHKYSIEVIRKYFNEETHCIKFFKMIHLINMLGGVNYDITNDDISYQIYIKKTLIPFKTLEYNNSDQNVTKVLINQIMKEIIMEKRNTGLFNDITYISDMLCNSDDNRLFELDNNDSPVLRWPSGEDILNNNNVVNYKNIKNYITRWNTKIGNNTKLPFTDDRDRLLTLEHMKDFQNFNFLAFGSITDPIVIRILLKKNRLWLLCKYIMNIEDEQLKNIMFSIISHSSNWKKGDYPVYYDIDYCKYQNLFNSLIKTTPTNSDNRAYINIININSFVTNVVQNDINYRYISLEMFININNNTFNYEEFDNYILNLGIGSSNNNNNQLVINPEYLLFYNNIINSINYGIQNNIDLTNNQYLKNNYYNLIYSHYKNQTQTNNILIDCLQFNDNLPNLCTCQFKQNDSNVNNEEYNVHLSVLFL